MQKQQKSGKKNSEKVVNTAYVLDNFAEPLQPLNTSVTVYEVKPGGTLYVERKHVSLLLGSSPAKRAIASATIAVSDLTPGTTWPNKVTHVIPLEKLGGIVRDYFAHNVRKAVRATRQFFSQKRDGSTVDASALLSDDSLSRARQEKEKKTAQKDAPVRVRFRDGDNGNVEDANDNGDDSDEQRQDGKHESPLLNRRRTSMVVKEEEKSSEDSDDVQQQQQSIVDALEQRLSAVNERAEATDERIEALSNTVQKSLQRMEKMFLDASTFIGVHAVSLYMNSPEAEIRLKEELQKHVLKRYAAMGGDPYIRNAVIEQLASNANVVQQAKEIALERLMEDENMRELAVERLMVDPVLVTEAKNHARDQAGIEARQYAEALKQEKSQEVLRIAVAAVNRDFRNNVLEKSKTGASTSSTMPVVSLEHDFRTPVTAGSDDGAQPNPDFRNNALAKSKTTVSTSSAMSVASLGHELKTSATVIGDDAAQPQRDFRNFTKSAVSTSFAAPAASLEHDFGTPATATSDDGAQQQAMLLYAQRPVLATQPTPTTAATATAPMTPNGL